MTDSPLGVQSAPEEDRPRWTDLWNCNEVAFFDQLIQGPGWFRGLTYAEMVARVQDAVGGDDE